MEGGEEEEDGGIKGWELEKSPVEDNCSEEMGEKRNLGSFSIEAILSESSSKRRKMEDLVKLERPESPASTTSEDISIPLPTTESTSPTTETSTTNTTDTNSPIKNSPSPSPSPPTSLSPSPKFPLWTQCQRDARRARRPYSRHTVALLSWWFHHLPFLAMEEMETVAWLAGLTRQQVKVWWQNRRHSLRSRGSGERDPYQSHMQGLPTAPLPDPLPEPGSSLRLHSLSSLVTFFVASVLPRLNGHF